MPALLVFDMGGVLYDFQGDRLLRASSRRRFRSEEAKRSWLPALQRFESGLSSAREFAAEAVRSCELRLSGVEFEAAFRDAAIGFYPGALELLQELGSRHELCSLSNTNPLQWSKVLEGLSHQDPFQLHHPSHLSGFRKPDRRAFEAVVRTRSDATAPYFFDDRRANVAVALGLGWRAHRVRGVAELRHACSAQGLL